jgi:5,6,7,8-tetrahydromethanopterin hydro-lyase
MLIGESAVGTDVNAAHINTVHGPRTGPVGTAWATALATPTAGHVPFVVVLEPSLPVKPFTLFVTKSAPESDAHRRLLWGAAQAGVAAGVATAVADGVIAADRVDDDVIIAAVWVNPAADDPDAVYRNNRDATAAALRNGADGFPALEQVLARRRNAVNPFYPGPGDS